MMQKVGASNIQELKTKVLGELRAPYISNEQLYRHILDMDTMKAAEAKELGIHPEETSFWWTQGIVRSYLNNRLSDENSVYTKYNKDEATSVSTFLTMLFISLKEEYFKNDRKKFLIEEVHKLKVKFEDTSITESFESDLRGLTKDKKDLLITLTNRLLFISDSPTEKDTATTIEFLSKSAWISIDDLKACIIRKHFSYFT